MISVYNFPDNTGNDPEYNERLLNRWYSMGRILVPDFDGNGIVNQADYDKAYAAMHPTQQPQRHVFATGNVHNAYPGERVIDQNDWLFWLTAWQHWQNEVHSGPLVEFDYGFAETPDLR